MKTLFTPVSAAYLSVYRISTRISTQKTHLILFLILICGTQTFAQTAYNLTVPAPIDVSNVAIDGERAVVANNNSAKVFEFNGTSWVLTATLNPSDPSSNTWDIRVDISGDKIIIGNPTLETAYVFEYNGSTWTETAKLVATLGSGGGFGFTVAIDNNQAVVGARWDYDDPEADEFYGAAYVFTKTGGTWNETTRLIGDHPYYDLFGYGVDIQGNRIAVAAYWEFAIYIYEYNGSRWVRTAKKSTRAQTVALADNRVFSGTEFGTPVYEYNGSAWSYDTTIKPAGIKDGDFYVEWYVSASGDRVTFNGAKTYGESPNVVYVCEKIAGTWTKIAEFHHPKATHQISGDRVIVGLGSSTVKIYDFSDPGSVAEAKITASDGAANDNFGNAVGIKGNTAIVGAVLDDSPASNAGSAYVFSQSGSSWSQKLRLTASDASAGDNFGASVDVFTNYAVIGARMNDDMGDASGSAYIFRRTSTSWVQHAKLLPADGAAGDHFGNSVAIYGNTAVVGAPDDDISGSANAGSAYIFKYNGSAWVQQAKLVASDKKSNDQFGWSVAINGNRVVIGAFRTDDKGGDSGSAYVFDYNGSTWIQKAKLTASDGASGDRLGVSVGVYGNTVIAGANQDDDAGSSSGSAYLFKYNGSTWSQINKLTAADAAADDRFGTSVSISGSRAVVGARGDNHAGGTNAGSVYVFTNGAGGWAQTGKLIASDASTGDVLGAAVDIDGNNVIAGAYLDDDHGSASGSAYVFDLSVAPAARLAYDAPAKGTSESLTEELENEFSAPARNMVKLAYPNPVQDQLTVKLDRTLSGPVTISLVDDAGYTLYSETRTINQNQEAIQLNLSQANLRAGVLFLRLDSKESTGVPFRLLKSK